VRQKAVGLLHGIPMSFTKHMYRQCICLVDFDSSLLLTFERDGSSPSDYSCDRTVYDFNFLLAVADVTCAASGPPGTKLQSQPLNPIYKIH